MLEHNTQSCCYEIFLPKITAFFIVMGNLLLLSFYYAVFPRHRKGSFHIFLLSFMFSENEALQKHLHIFFVFLRSC